jgi:MFS family permease
LENSTLKPSGTNPGAFAALRHRNYRLWFAGQLTSLVGTWMQNTAQGYLIFSLTGSAAYLGYVGFVSGLPNFLFMLYGGWIADRFPRRTLMIITQITLMLLAFVLAILVFLDTVQPWHILVLSFLGGVVSAFDTPARQSFVRELVDREDMTNAIALNATMFNAGSIIGPAIGGLVYAQTGPAWCFTINGISFVAIIIALLMMSIRPMPVPVQRGSAIESIAESFRYVRGNRMVMTLTVSVLMYAVFGFGLINLMPAWAVHILGGDVQTNGLLLSARGGGAVLGGLIIAATSSLGFRGKMWAVSSVVLPITMILFALTNWLPWSLFLLGITGLATIIIMNNSNAMVQSLVPDELRGRVMALYSMTFMAGGPVGALFIGLLAAKTSEPIAAIFCSVMLIFFGILIWFARPEVRRMA